MFNTHNINRIIGSSRTALVGTEESSLLEKYGAKIEPCTLGFSQGWLDFGEPPWLCGIYFTAFDIQRPQNDTQQRSVFEYQVSMNDWRHVDQQQ